MEYRRNSSVKRMGLWLALALCLTLTLCLFIGCDRNHPADGTDEPTAAPTDAPTEEPTAAPTEEPTGTPTEEPTAEVTEEPTEVCSLTSLLLHLTPKWLVKYWKL